MLKLCVHACVRVYIYTVYTVYQASVCMSKVERKIISPRGLTGVIILLLLGSPTERCGMYGAQNSPLSSYLHALGSDYL